MPLTVNRVKKLTKPGRYFDERGLYLQVLSSTNRSWLLRYERDGKERWMGLGPTHAYELDEAREEARKARKLLHQGIDPIDQRTSARAERETLNAVNQAKEVTFEQVAQQYFNFHQKKWRNDKHRAQFLSTLKDYAFPCMGKVVVAQIDTPLILKTLRRIWEAKPETANRVRARIEAVLNYATVNKLRTGDNPARWKGNLDQALLARSQLRKVVHHRALPYGDVPEFMAALRGRDATAARALEFTILAAARTGETIGARWDEIDLKEGVWTVPEGRMKAKREHRVPLTKPMTALLQKLPKEKGNPYVFLGPRSGGLSNMAMDAVLRRMGYKDRATTHGFRSAFRDWAAEMTSFAPEIAEAALAHATGDATERAYRRGDVLAKRLKLMEAWASYCAQPPRAANNVQPIRKAK
jgi:integrase